jgi:hypothetical protein
MKPNPTAAPADPVLLALVGGWLAAAALLLTLAGWRPASRSKAEFRDVIHGAPHGTPKTTVGNHPHPIPASAAQLAGLVGFRQVADRARRRCPGPAPAGGRGPATAIAASGRGWWRGLIGMAAVPASPCS